MFKESSSVGINYPKGLKISLEQDIVLLIFSFGVLNSLKAVILDNGRTSRGYRFITQRNTSVFKSVVFHCRINKSF